MTSTAYDAFDTAINAIKTDNLSLISLLTDTYLSIKLEMIELHLYHASLFSYFYIKQILLADIAS